MSFTELEYRSILFFWFFLNSTSSGVLVCSSSWKRGACVTHGETQLLTVSCELAANVASSCFSACSRSISRIECWHSNATHLNTVADQHPAGQCASPHHKQCTTESPSPANRLDHNPIKDPAPQIPHPSTHRTRSIKGLRLSGRHHGTPPPHLYFYLVLHYCNLSDTFLPYCAIESCFYQYKDLVFFAKWKTYQLKLRK